MVDDGETAVPEILGHSLEDTEGSVAVRHDALSAADEAALAGAVVALEGSSLAAQLSNLVGRQIGFAGELVPARVAETANKAATTALRFAMRAAVKGLPTDDRPASNRFHLAAVAASGAVGGAFGLATLPVELPLSTTIILRAVADIARTQGEDLGNPEALLACVEVFALGSARDAAFGESTYFAVRALLAKSVTEAARHMIGRGLADEAAPVLARLLSQIASRFGMVVTQKLLAQAVPVIGAVTGAAINAAFMNHYQTLARGHFTVRRLERVYGTDTVRVAYERLRAASPRNDPARGGRSSHEPDREVALTAFATKHTEGSI